MFCTSYRNVWITTWTTVAFVVVCTVSVVVGRVEDLPPIGHSPVVDLKTGGIERETKEAENTETSKAWDYTVYCPADDVQCKNDQFGFEAVQQLHAQIDDDQNGDVDRDESNEFLRDDLKLEDGLTPRSDLHGSDDLISVQDLWKLWSNSEAYRWTVDDVIDWLTIHVELPQYAINFRINDVNGRMLPRLTSFSSHSLLSIIGIKNPVHRQKLALKAADVVLFGPPKSLHSFAKDAALVVSMLIAVAGCYFAYVQHRRSQNHLLKLMKDLKALQKAEDALSNLQLQLKKAQTEQQIVTSAKHDVERKLKLEIDTAKAEAERLRTQRETVAKEQISCLNLAEDELTQLRKALGEAERQLQDRSSFVASDLQQWLQLTYEVETKYFETKRKETEQQLKEAREMCDKIRKQKDKFFGSFHVAHTNSLDDTDDKIIRVRRALEDVKKDLQERSFRWKEMESICGFNIIINPGIPYLNSLLRRSRFISCSGRTFQHMKKQSSFLEDDELQEGRSLAYLPESCTNQQVLQNLMRAGMQLSVVGVNLSEMNSAEGSTRDVNPSPMSAPLIESRSTVSLSSLGSFASLQRCGSHCTTATASSHSGWPVPPSAPEAAALSASEVQHSNGFVCEDQESMWSASHTDCTGLKETFSPSFAVPRQLTEEIEEAMQLEEELSAEPMVEVTSTNNKTKTKRSKKKLPFSKLLKGSINKEKTS